MCDSFCEGCLYDDVGSCIIIQIPIIEMEFDARLLCSIHNGYKIISQATNSHGFVVPS